MKKRIESFTVFEIKDLVLQKEDEMDKLDPISDKEDISEIVGQIKSLKDKISRAEEKGLSFIDFEIDED